MIQPVVPIRRSASHLALAGIIAMASVIPAYAAGSSMPWEAPLQSITALDAFEERVGVCRDYAHLAIALCRCMNVPARYCTGYMGDMDLPALEGEMDFSAWFEAYLGGRWYVFDARHNRPRKGRILMARGRDATDAALTTAFGSAILTRFQVYTDENRLPFPDLALIS